MTEQVASTTEQPSKTEVVSTTSAVSPNGEKSVESASLTEDKVKELIAKATEKAIEEGKKLGQREMQAIKDREVAEVKRRADLAEKRARALDTSLTDLDEDTRAKVEQHKTRSELEYYKTREQEESYQKQQESYREKMNQSLRDEVTVQGIDPNDKRLDYAEDAKDYFEGRKRFSESIAKILKSDKETLEKTILQKAQDTNKQFETELRKKYGLDSHDTTTQTGVVNQSDADFLKAFGNYEIPDNKENRTRYAEIMKKY